MGWTTYHATEYKNGKVDRKAECDKTYNWENETSKGTVLKSRMVGSVYYAAVKVERNGEVNVVGVVNLTCGQDKRDPYYNFGYKDMDETMGPCYYDCPKSILDLLTPTDSEYALNWRAKCRENLTAPKLKDVPVGAKIKWKKWDGTEKILTKMPPMYQFKRNWWCNVKENCYISQKYINNWELIEDRT